MRNILLNTWVIVVIMAVVGGSSFFYAFVTSEFLWVSRSGSILTVLGIMLTIKHNIFSESRDLNSVVNEKNHYAVWAPDEDSDEYKKQVEHARIVLRDEYLGAGLTLTGTILWGYGDLLKTLLT